MYEASIVAKSAEHKWEEWSILLLVWERCGDGGVAAALKKQGVAVNAIVEHNQGFSIEDEDFPALPGCKGELTLRRNIRRAIPVLW
jgi:hypothetical protein